MKFYFTLFNHTPDGRRSLEDPIYIIGNQLKALGHFVLHDPVNDAEPFPQFAIGPDTYNIIVEGFTPQITRHIEEVHKQGARFICLATEEPTERGFNHGTQREMVWRQDTFGPAMKFFEGIWHLVPGQRVTDWYAQYVTAAYVELGYAASLIRPDPIRNPRFDTGFYGSMTPRRLTLLKRLSKRLGTQNAVRIVMNFASNVERDAAMQDAKVILQVRKFEEMGLVSSSRCATALYLGRPVIAEPHDLALSHPWDKIVKFTHTEQEFLDLTRLTIPRWRDLYQSQLARFKELLPPEVCVAPALRALGLEVGGTQRAA